MPSVAWQPWHTAAFLDAQRRRRPVLLLLETAWSPACAQLHATVLARDDVQQAIAAAVVPVRVDADRRPDIGDRYGLGHWPSVLVLTPEGHVLTGGTQLDETFAARIRDVSAAFATRDGGWVRDAIEGSHAGHLAQAHHAIDDDDPDASDARARATLAAGVWATRDATSGAFTLHDVPSASSTLFALAHGRAAGDRAWLDAAGLTLDAVCGLVHGTDRSGVVAAVPGYGGGSPVARLEDQADWIRAHARALALGVSSRDGMLHRLVEGLRTTFRRPDGHFRPWAAADAATAAPGPTLVLVDASARACRALLAAADVLDDAGLAREAIDALEVLAPQAYARAAGVTHVIDADRPRGPVLLDDAMLLAQALADADPWRADDVYRDLADELLRTATARLQDGTGALVDRIAVLSGAGQLGRLGDPHHPLVGNAEAARLLVRLHPDDEAARRDARRVLATVTPRAAGAGAFAAPVALAWHALGPSGAAACAW